MSGSKKVQQEEVEMEEVEAPEEQEDEIEDADVVATQEPGGEEEEAAAADPEEGKKFAEENDIQGLVANWKDRTELDHHAIELMSDFYFRSLKGSRWLKYKNYGFKLIQDASFTDADIARRLSLHDLGSVEERAKGLNPMRDFAWLEHESGFRVPCFDPTKEVPAVDPEIPENIQKELKSRVYVATAPVIRLAWGFGPKPVFPPVLKTMAYDNNNWVDFMRFLQAHANIKFVGKKIDYSALTKVELFVPDFIKYFDQCKDVVKSKTGAGAENNSIKKAANENKKKAAAAAVASDAKPKKQPQPKRQQDDEEAEGDDGPAQQEEEEEELVDIVYDEQAQKYPLQFVCTMNRCTTEFLIPYSSEAINGGDASVNRAWIFGKQFKFKTLAAESTIVDSPGAEQRSIDEDVKRHFPPSSERKKAIRTVVKRAGSASSSSNSDDTAVIIEHLQSVVKNEVNSAVRPIATAVTSLTSNVNTLLNRTETLARRMDDNGGLTEAKIANMAGKVSLTLRKELFNELEEQRVVIHDNNVAVLKTFEKCMTSIMAGLSVVVPSIKRVLDAVEQDMKERKQSPRSPGKAEEEDEQAFQQPVKKVKAEPTPATPPPTTPSLPLPPSASQPLKSALKSPLGAAKPTLVSSSQPSSAIKRPAPSESITPAKKPAPTPAPAPSPAPKTPVTPPVAAKPKASPLSVPKPTTPVTPTVTPPPKRTLSIPKPKPPAPSPAKAAAVVKVT